MQQVQITLVSERGYRPLSTLVNVENWQAYLDHKEKIQQDAVISICAKRYMTTRDLRKYGYTTIKARIYDKERIEQENAARYEQIKKERGWT